MFNKTAMICGAPKLKYLNKMCVGVTNSKLEIM